MEQDDDELLDRADLGSCCICWGGNARNILTLPRRAPIAGRGWGCVQCGLPTDGAIAVVCDTCLGRYRRNNAELKLCCTGYPAHDGRTALSDLPPGAFEHDPAKHPELSDEPSG